MTLTEYDSTEIMYFYFEFNGENYKIEIVKK